jgi:hypothetical protein
MNSGRSNLLVSVLVVIAIALLLGVPFVMRPEVARYDNPQILVIASPHDQRIQHEFGRGFADWHKQHFPDEPMVKVEWPSIGGTGTIYRYLETSFRATRQKAWSAGDPPRQ